MSSMLRLLAAGLLSLAAPLAYGQCVSLTGSTYTQDFDTLSNSTSSSTVPSGWAFSESGTNAETTYAVSTGSSNGGNTYSLGSSASTDRAFGGLQSGSLNPAIGACFTNNTGGTLTSLDLAYTGEQWRLGATGRTDRIDFQYSTDATSLTTGAWSNEDTLDFSAPNSTGTAGALDGNNAANRTAISSSISGLSLANGATIWIRWTDFNATSSDDALGVDDFSLATSAAPANPRLSIVASASTAEGDSGTKTLSFTVTLLSPPASGVISFDIQTGDGSATTADNDYVAKSVSGASIDAGAGETTYVFDVTVNGDTTVEGDEAFGVQILNAASTDPSGIFIQDGNASGTIVNDDYALTPIHDIQGNGSTSPLTVGTIVATEGIVTGRTSNGFFLQAADADADADPSSSEGIFVYTGSTPSADAAVGARVRLSATLDEYQPSGQLPLTELKTVTALVQLSTGNALPTPVVLGAADADAGSPIEQLERYEGMRVAVSSLTVVAPVDGNINESTAASSSNGVFYGVITNVPRPFREPGISALDPLVPPPGVTPPVFDTNPERLRVRSTGQTGAPNIAVDVGDVVEGLVGVLDYGFGAYTITPDPFAGATVTLGSNATPVVAAANDEITVGGFNLLHFFDDVNDHDGATTLATIAYQNRLKKTSNAICAYARNPDVLGVVEVEHIKALSELATAINSNAGNELFPGSCSENPGYEAYLFEGNDVGGIDVGFLVKTAEVAPGKPRVQVLEIIQEGKDELFTNADGSTELLNDRPSLVLRARINQANGASQDVTIIANHLRSLIGVNSTGAGTKGWATVGERVRAKRAAQALYLAQLIQDRQASNPAERIVLLGDFNAYEFSDGLVDVMGIITGMEAAADAVVKYADSPIETPLTNMADLADAAERYSFSFDGNAQSLDHMVVNQAVLDSFLGVHADHARINADFGVDNYGDFGVPVRVSDHDPVVLYLREASFDTADLSVDVIAGPSPIDPGVTATYQVDVANAGPDDALGVKLDLSAAVDPARVSVTPAAGWSCGAPVSDGGSGMLVHCTLATLAVAGNGTFDVSVTTSSADAGQILTLGAAVSASTTDTTPGDASDSDAVMVTGQPDQAIVVAAPLGSVNPRSSVYFKATVTNIGEYLAYKPYVSFQIDAPRTAIRSMRSPQGRFTCSFVSGDDASSSWLCKDSHPSEPGQRDVISIEARSVRGWSATAMTVTGEVGALAPDVDPGNNSDSASAPVIPVN